MDDMPNGLTRLQAKAEAHGWHTSTNRATGEWKDKRIDSWLLRIQRDGVNLALTWESTDGGATWAFRSCLRQRPFCRMNSREALALIELTRDVAA